MRNQRDLSELTGVNLIKDNLCLDSKICTWARPEGENGIYSIGHAEAFVTWKTYLIVGNKFARGACDLKASSSIGLYGRYIEG